jgi:predicted nucleic acid-binding protein
MADALVVNTSPLIYLGNAGRLDLLRRVGIPRVLVPQSVFDEVADTSHDDPAARAVAEAKWIERLEPLPPPTGVIEWDLGPGESEVIAACLHFHGKPVMDDLAGRKCALAFGLQPTGTLGIVVSAFQRGHVDDPRQVILDLRASGMWLSDAVIERALRLAGVI